MDSSIEGEGVIVTSADTSLNNSSEENTPLIAFTHDDESKKAAGGSNVKVMGPFRLIAVLFFLGYGGSYGVEGAISKGPPGYVLLSFLIAPFIWSLPEALVTAELSTAIPTSGGNILWSKRAFGKFLAWQSGFWTLLSVMSVAVFPLMFFSFVQQVTNANFSMLYQTLVHIGMIVFISIMNIMGTKSVSGGNIIFSLCVMSPFFCLIVIALSKKVLSWEVMTSTQWEGTIDWRALVTTAIWSCGGYTSAGQLANDIHKPRHSFPLAIISVICLTLFFSLLPLATAICVDPHQSAWGTFSVGMWAKIAQEVGGTWLHFFMCFGGMLSSLGEMNSVFFAYSKMISYLATSEDFFVPSFFGRIHSRFNTPYIAVISLAVLTLVLSLLPFQQLLSFVVFLASV